MDFRKRERVVEGLNWLMVGIAAGLVAYTFASFLSSPADSQASLFPAEIVQPAPLPTEMAPVPVWGSGDNTASSNPTLDRTARGPRPSVVAPGVPIDPLSTLPPGVGPDF